MKNIILVASLTVFFFSCKKESSNSNREAPPASLNEMISEKGQNPDEILFVGEASASNNGSPHKSKEGYVYTESNDAGTNYVVIYRQNADGSLVYQSRVASGGAGTGNLFGSQGGPGAG